MRIAEIHHSNEDRTVKYTLQTDDGYVIEACALFFEYEVAKINYCISSQVGCNNSCDFCTSGHRKFIRNLSVDEICDQIRIMLEADPSSQNERFEVTYMGTGEPLNNVENVLLSARTLLRLYNKLERLNISTILPTVSIPLEMFDFFKRVLRFQFSLHFTNDIDRRKYFRRELPTINDSLNYLDRLSETLEDQYCINYILIQDVNDSFNDADLLISLAKIHSNAYIRVSEYVPIKESDLSSSTKLESFFLRIQSSGIKCKRFINMGKDIHASCGHFLAQFSEP